MPKKRFGISKIMGRLFVRLSKNLPIFEKKGFKDFGGCGRSQFEKMGFSGDFRIFPGRYC
jgi:hypothetical protein